MIIEARSDRPTLERLLRLYWSPVYAVVRRQGHGPHEASDLTQDFLTTVVLSRNLLDKADPERGRFRSFLRRALKNFLIDHHRAQTRKAAGSREVTLTGAADGSGGGMDELPEAKQPDLDSLFDRRWASALVQESLRELEDSLRADGMTQHWLAFDVSVASPALRGVKPLPLNRIGAMIGVSDVLVISNMLQTAKRRFRKILREAVAETVSSPGEVDLELAELKKLIGPEAPPERSSRSD